VFQVPNLELSGPAESAGAEQAEQNVWHSRPRLWWRVNAGTDFCSAERVAHDACDTEMRDTPNCPMEGELQHKQTVR
jgi:hypothetical protein